jgi:hypothetical protein
MKVFFKFVNIQVVFSWLWNQNDAVDVNCDVSTRKQNACL